MNTALRAVFGTRIAIAVLPCVMIGKDAAREGRISGRIVDPRGVPVRNRPVVLRHVPSAETNVITSTDEDGMFDFAAVAAASYEMIFEMPGFKRLALPATVMNDSDINIGTVALELAPIGDGIDVTPYTAPVSQSLNQSAEGSAQGRQFRGLYANIDYGFSVEIPGNVVGEGTGASAPNHGFAVRLHDESTVWVDASYDVAEPPYRFGSLNAKLGTLNAERKHWKKKEHGRETFHEEIAARGFDRGSPIIYRIQVDALPEDRVAAFGVFESIVKSFRSIPIYP